MPILRIEHPVSDFNGKKRAFDGDLVVGRGRSGLRRYQILQSIDDPNYVMIDLEFDPKEQAEGLLAALQRVWGNADYRII